MIQKALHATRALAYPKLFESGSHKYFHLVSGRFRTATGHFYLVSRIYKGRYGISKGARVLPVFVFCQQWFTFNFKPTAMDALKKNLILFILALTCFKGYGQNHDPADLLFLGPVSILFFSEHHYTEPEGQHHFFVSPGFLRLQISLKPPPHPALAVVKAGKPYLSDQYPFFWMELPGVMHGNTGRIPVCQGMVAEACDTLVSLVGFKVEEDSTYAIKIGFDETDSTIIQITITGRWPPTQMEGWRNLHQPDPLFENNPSLIRAIPDSPAGAVFHKPAPKIQPANSPYIQFKMKPVPPWADSIWEYHWGPANAAEENVQWTPTGRLLTLPTRGNQQWLLRLRSKGQPQFQEFTVEVQTPWYRQPVVIILAGLIIPLLGGLVYMWQKQYRIRKVATSQSDLACLIMGMQSSLGPHIMMNAVGALRTMIIGGQWEKAKMYCSELTGLLRHSLARQIKVYSLLEEELNEIHEFIDLQQVKLPFKYEERIENPMWSVETELPTGLLLPLIENAVKYNMSSAGEEQYLYLDLFSEGAHLCIAVRAIGSPHRIQMTDEPPQPSAGYGLPWVNTRIALHNRMFPAEPIQMRLKKDITKSEALIEFKNKLVKK